MFEISLDYKLTANCLIETCTKLKELMRPHMQMANPEVVLEIPLDKELTANCLRETCTKFELMRTLMQMTNPEALLNITLGQGTNC